MPDDLYGFCDDVEPRQMPKQASKYDVTMLFPSYKLH